MKRNGFSLIETLVAIAMMITLASVLVLGYYGLRDVVNNKNAELADAGDRMQVLAAWSSINVDSETEATEVMRRRQPTGELPKWDTPAGAELARLDWRVRR